MAHSHTDPTDEDIERRLLDVAPDGWRRLWSFVDQLGGDVDLMRWAGGDQVGTTVVNGVETPVRQVPYSIYSDAVNGLVRQLYDLNLVVPFNWPEWDGTRRYRAGRGLDEAPVADAVRVITAVIRADRFSDGAVAAAIEDGTLTAALRRLRLWQDDDRRFD